VLQVGCAEVKAEFERISKRRGCGRERNRRAETRWARSCLTDCGSVGFCSIGVAVLVYPDGVWYGQVQAEDVSEIIEEHLEKEM
jgi:(2Fe-2S) ferredoxin